MHPRHTSSCHCKQIPNHTIWLMLCLIFFQNFSAIVSVKPNIFHSTYLDSTQYSTENFRKHLHEPIWGKRIIYNGPAPVHIFYRRLCSFVGRPCFFNSLYRKSPYDVHPFIEFLFAWLLLASEPGQIAFQEAKERKFYNGSTAKSQVHHRQVVVDWMNMHQTKMVKKKPCADKVAQPFGKPGLIIFSLRPSASLGQRRSLAFR